MTNYLVDKEPTHHQPSQRSSILDLIITKDPDDVNNLVHLPPPGSSDHDLTDINAVTKAAAGAIVTNVTSNKSNIDHRRHSSNNSNKCDSRNNS